MRAIRIHGFGGTDSMRLDEIPRPGPRAGEVLVKIAAKIVWHGRSIALRMAELMDSARAAPADPRGDLCAASIAAAGPILSVAVGIDRIGQQRENLVRFSVAWRPAPTPMVATDRANSERASFGRKNRCRCAGLPFRSQRNGQSARPPREMSVECRRSLESPCAGIGNWCRCRGAGCI